MLVELAFEFAVEVLCGLHMLQHQFAGLFGITGSEGTQQPFMVVQVGTGELTLLRQL